MRNYILIILGFFLIFNVTISYANQTKRIPQFSNDKVNVWETIIYPSQKQELKMHHHEHNRVLVALDTGKLKITNNHGQTHYLNLEKDKVYYLQKDIVGEEHTDENISDHPIKVIVIELIENP